MRWKPDTCNCIIEFNADWDTPVFTSIDKCAVHSSIMDNNLVWQQVYHQENKMKNRLLGMFEEKLPAAFDSIVGDDGTIRRVLKQGKTVTWSFGVNRVLNILMNGFSINEKTVIQLAADKQFGVGKVLIT